MKKESGKRLAGGTPSAPDPLKPKKSRRLTWQQIVLIVLVVVLALALIGTLIWRSLFVKPELPNRTPNPNPSQTGDTLPKEPEIDYGDGIRPRADGERKSADYYTILIIGRDTGGGGLTDTILLASYDVTNQKAAVMSIPRDTMVNVPWDIKKINGVYNYYGGGDKGIQHLYKEISQLVGFEPDWKVVVEWDAVGEIVDAMGGVYFDVPRNMNYDDPLQDLHIHQTEGYRLLTGDDAMQVLRYRHDNRKNGIMPGYPEGDLGRVKTQQAFLKAMLEQLLQVKNMTKIGNFITVFQNNVETDLSFQNILWFAQQAVFGGLGVDNVNFVTMPNYVKDVYSRTTDRSSGGRYTTQNYVLPNAKQLLELVNNDLSPFKETFTMSDLDIMSVNSDGSIRSSTGYVEDKAAAAPPVRVTEPPEEEPPEEEDPNNPSEENPDDPNALPADPDATNPDGGTSPGGSTPDSPNTSNPSNPSAPDNPGTTPPVVTPPEDPNPDVPPQVTPDPGGSTDPVAPPPEQTPEPPPEPETPIDPGIIFIEPPPE